MTEDEARHLLRAWGGADRLEGWIAEQDWQPAPGGWTVVGTLRGWCFRLETVGSSIRVTAHAPGGGSPAMWVVRPRG
jgi:hypothetical protein